MLPQEFPCSSPLLMTLSISQEVFAFAESSLRYFRLQILQEKQEITALAMADKSDEKMATIALASFLSGALSSGLGKSVVAPLDRTKISFQAVREMVKKEGWRSVYLGYTASLVGVIPSSGVLYGMYGLLKTTYGEYKGRELNALEQSACGSLSGATAMAISYPMEIVRRRHQAAAIVGERKTTIFETLKSIHK
ncbi:mitochondrial coenzyme A transporter SLC25A42-like [Hetaerina americana]|uniref:mitochondrial coenzyme A transporter SLC25A42-like n=1 Tax=Hetaerina americana TaxID=62018 RepID=UPI003A7F549C